MNHHTSTTHHGRERSCPSRTITVELPLATIEELDHLAELAHLSRQDTLRQIITAALLSDTPHRPTGPDASDQLAAHADLTQRRSFELATSEAER